MSTLNSCLYTGGIYAQITLGTKEGLIPAQAERWEVSEDRLAYIFIFRRGNRWYDGTSVTAWDYKAAFIYQMEPGRGSKWIWDTPLHYVEKAMDFRNGAARAEEVGVDVVDDCTLRVRRAIVLGFNKRRIMEAIFLGRETPMDMLSTPAMPDWDPGFGMRFDPEEARWLLSEAGYPGGKGIPESVILIPSYLAPEMVSQFVVIAAMLEENLGIYADKRVSLNPSEYVGVCFAVFGAPWPNPIYGAHSGFKTSTGRTAWKITASGGRDSGGFSRFGQG